MDNIRNKTISGFIYKFLERAGAQGLKFVITLVLARVLMPSEFGVVSLVTVFITVCDVFVTYGFGNSLIANKKSDDIDFSTCFYFSIVLSWLVYTGVFFLAPHIAAFYQQDMLTPVLRVMALRIPIAAINSVQHAYVSKHMMFAKFFYATLIGTVISGIVAIVMAYSGCGVWALVAQYLGNACLDTICLWIIVGWRPIKAFSLRRLQKIYDYGWKVLVVGLIDTGYNQLRSLVIGKRYTSSDLAYYNKGISFPSTGMSLIEPTVNAVLFPSLSHCRDNVDEMRKITRRVIKTSTYIICPIMIGLACIATALVSVLLTDKWLPAVTYLQIGCVAYLIRPLQFINSSIIRASGRSDLLLKLDIIKKSIGIVLLLVSIRFGVIGIAASLIVTYFISAVINIAPNKKLLNYGYLAQISDVGVNLILAAIMGGVVFLISLVEMPALILLVVQIVCGVIVYVGLSFILKNESFCYLLRVLKNIKKIRTEQ